MNITWTSHDYGREGELARLNKDRNDHTKHPVRRKQADQAHRKIVSQLKDKKLMSMRLRLIKASQAGDEVELVKIQQLMKAHTGEDRETGSYEQRS